MERESRVIHSRLIKFSIVDESPQIANGSRILSKVVFSLCTLVIPLLFTYISLVFGAAQLREIFHVDDWLAYFLALRKKGYS